MCPTLQETESESTEFVGVVGGEYQYGRKLQPYQSNPNQGQHTALRFAPVGSMPGPSLRYQAQPFRQQPQQQSVGSENIPSQTILNSKGGGLGVVKIAATSSTSAESETSQSQDRTGSRLLSTTISQSHPTAISHLNSLNKEVLKYARFLKELCIHKRKKIKGAVEMGGIMSALVKHEDVSARVQRILPKKCQDLGIFSMLCTIDSSTFADAMLDLGAFINFMPTSVYRLLNFKDLEPTGMVIQLANRSVVQPLGVLEDVLVWVNELIFLVDFYVLDIEDEALKKGSTLILG
ncbi:hypothetical protein CR513_47506, partial [Mucuna pruriens]